MVRDIKSLNNIATTILSSSIVLVLFYSNPASADGAGVIVSRDNLEQVERSALSGDRNASEALVSYFFEYGSSYPSTERTKWFLVASKLGDANGMAMLASEYYGNGACKAARYWVQRSISQTYNSDYAARKRTSSDIRSYDEELLRRINRDDQHHCVGIG